MAKTYTKAELINKLCDDDCDTVRSMIEDNDYTYIDNIFRHGFKGYKSMTKQELMDEFYERIS